VAETLGEDLLNTGCVLYIDDVLIVGDTEDEFVSNWIKVVERLHRVGFKVAAKKTCFYAKEVKYCGRVFSADGVRFDPDLISSVQKMAEPRTAGELRSFLATANWLRPSIPAYAELVEPLQALLNDTLSQESAFPHRNPKNRPIDPKRWVAEGQQRFKQINQAIANSVCLSYPDPNKIVCVFTDASDLHWAGIVTQTTTAELSRPFSEQVHEPLAFVSGSFRGSQLNWPTVEKEGLAVMETVNKCEHLLVTDDGFKLFSDHNNLSYLFSLDDEHFKGRKAAKDRVERWIVAMRRFVYSIEHIPGIDNHGADMLSRWANPEAARDLSFVAAKRVTTRLQSRATTKTSPINSDDIDSNSDDTDSDSGDTDSDSDNTDSDSDDIDSDSDSDASIRQRIELIQRSIEIDPADAPTLAAIRYAQQKAEPSQQTLKKLSLHLCQDKAHKLHGLWVDAQQRVYIPDHSKLRVRLFVVAHQGLGGHRGIDTTMRWLREKVTWEGMVDDVTTLCKGCLHCLRCKGSNTEPRPWLNIPPAPKPNHTVHFDYLFIRKTDAEDEPEYVLVIIDGFSRFVKLTAHKHANATNTAKALMDWVSLFGIPTRWVSDMGRHFLNQTVSQLRYHLGTDHHFTAAYAPWSNGLVERANREIVGTLSALVSESRINRDAWPDLLPAVNSILNQMPSKALRNKAPVEAFLGREVRSPLEVIFRESTSSVHPIDAKAKLAEIGRLRRSLDQLVKEASYLSITKTPKRRGAKPINYDDGDYVLAAKTGARKKDKTAPKWDGPYVVVTEVSPKVFELKDLITGQSKNVHADHIRRYADKQLVVTEQLKNFVVATTTFTIRDILDCRKHGRTWEVLVAWEGFDDDESTWQEVKGLYKDAPEAVKRFIKSVQDESIRIALTTVIS
jgi:transposase InsO family protein